jgi:hypothetical protein
MGLLGSLCGSDGCLVSSVDEQTLDWFDQCWNCWGYMMGLSHVHLLRGGRDGFLF